MRNLYNQWMNKEIKEYTKTSKTKRPSYLLIATWVKEAWEAVDINMIRKSFTCCGIFNAMDGTEDDLIFDFMKKWEFSEDYKYSKLNLSPLPQPNDLITAL
ncbi:25853_t:CDS:2 [Racocetra persica]|uniref:25853_t:CDS:1 n=1 Tax=Racocetra persica TaxID=160502 RepID=A0ACA9R9F8_9GLOM|nr:25853_t:CDS:2 [Racocetra persica]